MNTLRPMIENPGAAGHDAIAYHRNAQAIRTVTHRLVLHKDGYTELYDHTSSEGETKNVSEGNAELVQQLTTRLRSRLSM